MSLLIAHGTLINENKAETNFDQSVKRDRGGVVLIQNVRTSSLVRIVDCKRIASAVYVLGY